MFDEQYCIHVIERKMKSQRRWRRSCRKLPDKLKEKRRYWILKEEALDSTFWRSGSGRRYGTVTMQTTQ
jgi:hypothetical protein